jgi:hypothetical protein
VSLHLEDGNKSTFIKPRVNEKSKIVLKTIVMECVINQHTKAESNQYI